MLPAGPELYRPAVDDSQWQAPTSILGGTNLLPPRNQVANSAPAGFHLSESPPSPSNGRASDVDHCPHGSLS
eukprot:3259337-Pyramimonas_sp.AAC.1